MDPIVPPASPPEPAQAQLPLPAQAPVVASPATPAPVVPAVSVSAWEQTQKELAQARSDLKAFQDKQTRFDKAINLLTGKTDESTAALPPDVVSQLALAKSAADKAWRRVHAQQLASDLAAHRPSDIAAMVQDHAAFAVNANGELMDQPTAVKYLSELKADKQTAYLFRSEAVQAAITAQTPGAGTRPPVPQNPGAQVPVAPAMPPYKSPQELYALPIKAMREYNAAVKAAKALQ